MNILIVCDVLGEENNGTTIAAMNLIRSLKERGENVFVLCGDQEKKNDENTFVVPNVYLGQLATYILKKNNVTLSFPKKSIIKKALENIDIVHIMIPFALGVKTAKLARKKGIPVTAGFHAQAENMSSHLCLMNNKLFNHVFYKVVYEKLYSRVNAIHYPTEFIQNLFEKEIKIKTNGHVISNGVNEQFIKIPDFTRDFKYFDKIVILFIGRLSKEKNHSDLIKAVAKSKYKDKIQLIFAGQGPKYNKLMNLSKRLKINTPIVKFYSRNELVEVINSCDLYVHPSLVEIEAISCLEAISCGLVPIISNSPRSATNKFALSEMNLFDYRSYKDLTNKIDYWIEHPKEKEECSKKYQDFTKDLKMSICQEKMHKMLLAYNKEINHTSKKVFYYKDEINDDFANNRLEKTIIKDNFKYFHSNKIYRFFSFILYYIIAKPIIFCINKIIYKQKIVNCLTCDKKAIKCGYIYANHTLSMGDSFTPNIIFKNRNNLVCGSEAYSLKGLRGIINMLGAYPLASSFKGAMNFLNEMKKHLDNNEFFTIYPEAHIWPKYTKIRPFNSSSFIYPVKFNTPVICVTNTYQKIGKTVRLVTYLDGPYYPDLSLGNGEAKEELRNVIYEQMNKRSKECEQFEKYKYINLKDLF